ncbi:GNAT family N-acetyltransferase [Tsukamurella ocularis]|uniref:GNAT family N-acetyltransferase n=1 Tax=Tsukamurella ocularis TaxID=1970234 RepID=UPI0039EF0D07
MIARADFGDPALAAFLTAHHADMAPTAPPESQHALGLEELRASHVRLWTMHDDGALVGTVALAGLEDDHEELKSMRTAPQARGRGIARRLLAFALDDARARGINRISLETGAQEFFAPARALYAAHGFAPCPPFGHYVDDPNSVFLTRPVHRE